MSELQVKVSSGRVKRNLAGFTLNSAEKTVNATIGEIADKRGVMKFHPVETVVVMQGPLMVKSSVLSIEHPPYLEEAGEQDMQPFDIDHLESFFHVFDPRGRWRSVRILCNGLTKLLLLECVILE